MIHMKFQNIIMMEQNKKIILKDKHDLLRDHKVQCIECGKIEKMPPYVHSIVAGLCPEADIVNYTYNCKCGNKQAL